jgi:hypothetical protein
LVGCFAARARPAACTRRRRARLAGNAAEFRSCRAWLAWCSVSKQVELSERAGVQVHCPTNHHPSLSWLDVDGSQSPPACMRWAWPSGAWRSCVSQFQQRNEPITPSMSDTVLTHSQVFFYPYYVVASYSHNYSANYMYRTMSVHRDVLIIFCRVS